MSLLDPIFKPLLSLPVIWVVVIVSLIIAFIITIVYKLMTNQDLMKQLKDEMKALQKEMKELRSHPEKMMEVQKKAMQTNMKYMMHSMRSTLVTFIPIIVIFGWMNANIAYEPILAEEKFSVVAVFDKEAIGNTVDIAVPGEIEIIGDATQNIESDSVKSLFITRTIGKAEWELKGKEGEYLLEFSFNNEKGTREVLITNEQAYKPVTKRIKNNKLKELIIDNKPMKILKIGTWKIGWLGTYIIFSLIFSMVLRKILKVY